MSSQQLKIFLTGATGYIGGAVLQKLIDHPDASNFDITVLIRSQAKVKGFEKHGIKPVLGSFDDLDLIEKLASEADYVFAIADADHLPVAKAVLRGMKRHYEQTKKKPVLIHTSGTGVLADDAAGQYSYDTVWNDADAEQMASLAPTQLHRDVDLTILQADEEGYLESYIILPSTIYGLGTGSLVDEGLVNAHSIQIPSLIKASIDRGQAALIGPGKNLWPNVHIQDVSQLYIVLFDAIRKGANPGHGKNGYYFGEGGEHSLHDIGKAIAEALSKRGIGNNEPESFTQAEANKYFGGNYLGSNSRCKADHSRAIGWKPTKTTSDMLASIEPEVEAILAKQQKA